MFMYLFGKDLRCVLNFIGQKAILDLVFSRAKSIVERAEENKGILNIAITLGPEVIKSKALQVHYLMTLGLSDALAALAPPEIEISHLWPNFMFMNRGLMGKILLFDLDLKISNFPLFYLETHFL